MTDNPSKPGAEESGCSVAVVIVVVLLVLSLPCVAGVLFVARSSISRVPMPQPMPLPPVPGANAPLSANVLIPPAATITVNDLTWSGNLFDAADEILTRERYDRIEPGMTYEEVLSVLAIPEHKRPENMELVGPQSSPESARAVNDFQVAGGDRRGVAVSLAPAVDVSADDEGG